MLVELYVCVIETIGNNNDLRSVGFIAVLYEFLKFGE